MIFVTKFPHLEHSPEVREVVCGQFQRQEKLVLEKVEKDSDKQQLTNEENTLVLLVH